jgi:hypothetical protein
MAVVPTRRPAGGIGWSLRRREIVVIVVREFVAELQLARYNCVYVRAEGRFKN